MTTTHSATATRDGRWWLIEVDGIGATQAKSLNEARGVAADLIAVVLEVDERDVEIDLRVTLDDDLQAWVERARATLEFSEWIRDQAAHMSRWATWELTTVAGLTGRDAAEVLGVTPQRVSQLLQDLKRVDAKNPETAESRSQVEALLKAFHELVGA